MRREKRDIKLELFCINACAHTLTILFVLGWVVCAGFLPAPSPLESAGDITARYLNNTNGIRVGTTLMLISFGIWAAWGAGIASWTRRVETGTPILTYVQITSLTIAEMIGVLCAFFWACAAFRPGDVSPDVTLTLNDMGWLMFLIAWPPYSVWAAAVGFAVLRDRSKQPMLPNWTAGLSFLTAFLFAPALAPLFFKRGGFAYDGLLGMYLPLVIFFIWVEALTYAMSKALKRELRNCSDESQGALETSHV